MCARSDGDTVLRKRILEPALAGEPPFVLSDAFPGNWLPVPAVVRLSEWPPEQRTTVKRAKWLSQRSFGRLQRGELPAESDLILASGVHDYTHLRNTIGRSCNSTAGSGGLFPSREAVLGTDADGGALECLTVYARVRDEFAEQFWHLVQELGHWGFGADRSVGRGQFHVGPELESASELDAVSSADGVVVLSTFQPAVGDPTSGAWDTFTKYGKLGPDFGVENVFKRPMILFRPGACFLGHVQQG
jgi:hypothetical protein